MAREGRSDEAPGSQEDTVNVGMLWFDNDPKAGLSEKVDRAAQYYALKYGQVPNICFVHPSMAKEAAAVKSGVEIRSTQMVLPHHLWIGVREAPQG